MILKQSQLFRHDLFKSSLANFKRNTSWTIDNPRIQNIPHIHFFHSHNSQGRPQKYTNNVGGHFHEVETYVDENGNIIAKCGPALRKVTKRLKNGKQKRVIEPVKWFDENRESDGKDPWIVDDHSHILDYQYSEEINPHSVMERQGRNAQAMQAIAAEQRTSVDLPDVSMTVVDG